MRDARAATMGRMRAPELIRCSIYRPQAEKANNGPDARVARLAARRWGVVTLADLQACGLSADAVTSRIEAGRLHRIHRGVYAVGHAGLALQGRLLAAALACGPD